MLKMGMVFKKVMWPAPHPFPPGSYAYDLSVTIVKGMSEMR